ncbi:hypothetical protein A6C57_09545 [Fibrella sp. ES10-3-2-2]|nr:hypothetical protein A6C57_09545 [Fibrella sp. ES10-3-2-2]
MLAPVRLTLIDQHLRRENWLRNDDLIAELTDHYADALSDKLAKGVPFELALEEVCHSFGGRIGLLTMEENYLKMRPHARFHLYRNAFLNAFRRPVVGYTLLILAGCSLVVQLLNIDWIYQPIDALRLNGWGWLFTGGLSGLFTASRMQIQFKLQKGTLRLSPASPPPAWSLLQSTTLILIFLVLPPIHEFAEGNAGIVALLMTLLFVHNWAWIRMLKIHRLKRPTAVA